MRTLTENVPSYAKVKHRVNELKRAREHVEYDPRPGRAPAATTNDNLNLALGSPMGLEVTSGPERMKT